MKGILVQHGKPSPIVVSSPDSKLDNILPSIIREVCLLVHVLNVKEAEIHQFVPHSDWEVRDHQRLHEVFRVRPATVGFDEPEH